MARKKQDTLVLFPDLVTATRKMTNKETKVLSKFLLLIAFTFL